MGTKVNSVKEDRVISVELSFSAREDGMLEAAYFHFRKGAVAETRELVGTSVMGDYDKHGKLIGLEILSPVPLRKLEKFVAKPDRPTFRQIAEQRAGELVGA
jgi:uncharacterized protein YuzE